MNKKFRLSNRKQTAVERFGDKAGSYEQNADIQQKTASRLARMLPKLARPDVLEIGCGTGFLTRHLFERYQDGQFLITDLSQRMLQQCEKNYRCQSTPLFDPRLEPRFELMDGEVPRLEQKFDLIATSMTVQWFEHPRAGLVRLQTLLKPGGHLLYSTVGANLFPQWRHVLAELNLPSGIVEVGDLPGETIQDVIPAQFESGLHFFNSLRVTGAWTPHAEYRNLSPGALRRALRLFEEKMACRADWKIIYGHLRG